MIPEAVPVRGREGMALLAGQEGEAKRPKRGGGGGGGRGPPSGPGQPEILKLIFKGTTLGQGSSELEDAIWLGTKTAVGRTENGFGGIAGEEKKYTPGDENSPAERGRLRQSTLMATVMKIGTVWGAETEGKKAANQQREMKNRRTRGASQGVRWAGVQEELQDGLFRHGSFWLMDRLLGCETWTGRAVVVDEVADRRQERERAG
ncbi:hypothetical protein CIHG_02899 [Coccidioides immitis H538.4]|uniref:Uncharacterized protein n=3 Tax=Coccidioides immitis TaxID=5501 RepID=A0A0J8R1I9_COCIT|nr:hypothetical protein CIRG_07609 [Coccidioides immitis RMSCC 2394]KMU79034.1 hypothetical protein CISG_07342 [Coccidioides immitis RMSCC 3703]KMU85117.1 hypothetical protein CIHG_02899 [Coccidioides immitis H538.4]